MKYKISQEWDDKFNIMLYNQLDIPAVAVI